MIQPKYPKDYEVVSLGSDKSDYEPVVGERNYVQTKLPKKENESEDEKILH